MYGGGTEGLGNRTAEIMQLPTRSRTLSRSVLGRTRVARLGNRH